MNTRAYSMSAPIHRGNTHRLYVHTYIHVRYIYIYTYVVRRSIAAISDPRRHIYRGAKCQGEYTAEVGYRGYRPTYRITYCSTVSAQQMNLLPETLLKTTPFSQKSISHISDHLAMPQFLWLCNHCAIYNTYTCVLSLCMHILPMHSICLHPTNV